MKSSYLAIVNDLKLLVLVGTCEVEYDVNEEERIHCEIECEPFLTVGLWEGQTERREQAVQDYQSTHQHYKAKKCLHCHQNVPKFANLGVRVEDPKLMSAFHAR